MDRIYIIEYDLQSDFSERVEGSPGSSKPMAWAFKVHHPRLLNDVIEALDGTP